MRRSLPLPPEDVLSIEVGAPERASVDGHDLLVVDYSMSGILVSDEESPAIDQVLAAKITMDFDVRYGLDKSWTPAQFTEAVYRTLPARGKKGAAK